MAKQIAVLGSTAGLKSSEPSAEAIGKTLVSEGFTVLTGACYGLPMVAAKAAKREGGLVIGMHPGMDASDVYPYHYRDGIDSPGVFDSMIYTGLGIKGRNVILVRSADAVITVGGRIGTVNEFTIAYDDGKLIGVLEGSGGASDMIRPIEELGYEKKTGARVVYVEDPVELVSRLSELLRS